MTIENTLPVNETDDLLWKHLKTIPAFRGILRAVEARFYQQIEIAHPILDVGCGDGHFAQVTFDEQVDVGIDPWWGPLQHAKQNRTYGLLLQGLGNEMPFPNNYFASAISNSVLEHIPNIQAVLNETGRVLQENGRFVMTMPCHHFDEYLGGAAALRKIGANGLAERYRTLATKVTRHVHVDQPETWASRLAQAGLKIERWQYYFSPGAVRALEIGHVQGLPSAILRALTGHWIVAPWEDSLSRTERWLRPYYEEETATSEGGYIFIVARKVANHPIEAFLPEPNPFTIAELRQAEAVRLASKSDPSTIPQPLAANHGPPAMTAEPPTLPSRPQADSLTPPVPPRPPERTNLFNYTTIIASLFLAIIGQLVISGSPTVAGRGLIWFILAGIGLFIVGFQQNQFSLPPLPTFHWPSISGISGRRWLILPAILLSMIAQGIAGGAGGQRPFLAVLTWFAAVGLGDYALRRRQRPGASALTSASDKDESTASSFLKAHFLFISFLLFGVAFLIRIFDVSGHPFMINGIESSLGLDALNVIRGNFTNPFGVGWLTNPALPSFVAALPIRIFGPTTFSVRLLSTLIGALTVTAVFFFGQKLWQRSIGLLAAVLLAGSHFHIHYSRLGMYNIWDPLLTLMAMGLLAWAWREQALTVKNRRLWLLAGLFTGLNAYFFTASRLLPIMLIVLLILALLLERQTFQAQFRNILAAALLAFVVALPQILFYYNHPGIWMDRAVQVGILANQTGWLAEQAASRGLTETVVLRQQLWQALTTFNGGIDRSPSYRPEVPLLSFGPGLFFAIGVLIGIFKFGQHKFRMLLIWVAVTLIFAGALLLDLPNSHRLIIATPALALLGAVALKTYGDLLLNALPESLNRRYKRWLEPLLLLIAVLFVMGDLAFYYGRYRQDSRFGDRNTEVADVMATYLESQAEPATAYFLGPPSMFSDFPTLTFIAQSFQRGINLFDVHPGETAVPPGQTNNLLFIALPERVSDLDLFRVQYPGGTLQSFSGVYGNPLFLVYEVEQ